MAGGMTNYLEDKIVAHIFRTASFTKPTDIGIALCTGAPFDGNTGYITGAGGINLEISGNAYVRQSLSPADANWAATTLGNGLTSNVTQITFPEATADWGTITHIGVTDNTGYPLGNLLFWNSVTTSKTIQSGDQLIIKANQLTFTFD